MRWGPRARRRADDFAALVEGHDQSAEHTELIALVDALRAVPAPEPRPEFVADLRSRLLTEAATVLAPPDTPDTSNTPDVAKLRLPARGTARERRLTVAVAGLVIAGTTASVAVAAQSALPGESLYPVKRAIESARSGLAPGDGRKGDVELAHAASRLDEAMGLARSAEQDAALRIGPTLATFADQAGAGADLLLADYAETGRGDAIAQLRDFVSDSMARLEQLEPLIPDAARDELVAAAAVLAELDAAAERECPDCGGAALDGIPPSLVAAQIPLLSAVPSGGPTTSATTRAPEDPPRWSPEESRRTTVTEDGSAADRDGRPGAPSTTSPGAAGPDPGPDTGTGPGPSNPAGRPSPSGQSSPSGQPSRPGPIRSLTDGLAGALTGAASTPPGPSSGSDPQPSDAPTKAPTESPAGPLTAVVDGVDEVLDGVLGVLDPVTGRLLPGPQ